jgi:pyruvate/2-oxoglutarate dehydrogenase complex dihydrolipoamide dehydrogenase (E3) component
MTVEYDLIVIGGSRSGAHAAVAAARLNARVALIEPQQLKTNWLANGAIYTQALARVGRIAQQLRDAPQLGIHCSTADSTEQQLIPSVELTEAMQWAQAVVDTRSEQDSPAVLGSLGIDVITEAGEFCRRPHLGFVVSNRRLRSRAYLIATGSRPEIPDIDGLQTISYFTPADICQPDFAQKIQGCWLVIGAGPISIEIAQTLARLNCKVTLVTNTPQILPNEDSEASHLVQAQLEAEGIHVLTESPVTQVRRIEDKTWVQAGNHAIEADEIMLAAGQQLNIEALNLEGVGVKFNRHGLELNEKLQTTNPRIYACGDFVDGFRQDHIAQYEASIALKNALFFPWFKVDYRGIPRAIFCDPQLAQVGLTEAQARRRYGKDVFVVRQYFKTLDKAQLLGETTGFCKIVGRQDGEILGASIVGPEASELIGAIALLVRQKIKLKASPFAAIAPCFANGIATLHANLPHVSPTLSEIIHLTALEWQRQRNSRNKTLQDFLEGFFNLRRSWS